MNGLCLCPAQGPHPSAGKVAAKGEDLSRIAPASLASRGSRGWGGSSFRSRRSFPTPRPQQSLRLHPHPQRQFQSAPSSSPWLSAGEITKAILVLSHSQNQRTLRYIPVLHPSPLEANEFPGRPPAGACLGVRPPPVCVGEGVYVSAHRSLSPAVGGPDTCAWCACVCTS